MLVLPSERLLRDYSNVVKAGDGFNLDVIQQLPDKARLDGMYMHTRLLTDVALFSNISVTISCSFIGRVFDELFNREDWCMTSTCQGW